MHFEPLQVGQLAARSGVTVRTLHHYDHLGLVVPSQRTEAGYRLYTPADIARLQHVLSLRQLGFSLDEVGDCLHSRDFSPLATVRLHVARLREQIDLQRALCARLEAIADRLNAAGEVSAEEFLGTIEAITMTEKYFTPEQQSLLAERRAAAGDDVLQQKQEEWADLIAELRTAMDAGADPASAPVQTLAARWRELLHSTTAGDPAIERSLKRLWDEQGDALAAQHGSQYDPRPVFDYVSRAIEAGRGTRGDSI